MQRDNEAPVELIDLGAASVETKGPGGVDIDAFGRQLTAGISDD